MTNTISTNKTTSITNTNPKKFCKDCKYSKAVPYTGERFLCTHEISTTKITTGNLVVGTKEQLTYNSCSRMRVTNCGEEGHLFEEREDLVYKVIKFFKKIKP